MSTALHIYFLQRIACDLSLDNRAFSYQQCAERFVSCLSLLIRGVPSRLFLQQHYPRGITLPRGGTPFDKLTAVLAWLWTGCTRPNVPGQVCEDWIMVELENGQLADRVHGRMRVSLERGTFKDIDADKVIHGRFLTEKQGWLSKPVEEFLGARIGLQRGVLDPFAGEGHLLQVCAETFECAVAGYDIQPGIWDHNDSLMNIPNPTDALIVTNPPYLASHSAQRKGVRGSMEKYFALSNRTDLYQIALDRCLEASDVVVAIVPETILLSGYPRTNMVLMAVIESELFSDTDAPVSVVCFDKSWQGKTTLYLQDELVGWADEILALRKFNPSVNTEMKFNVESGRFGLRAVDGTLAEDRIRFFPAEEFDYPRNKVKVSSRLMTYLEIPSVGDIDVKRVAAEANSVLSKLRAESRDLIFAPFKGNAKSGRRRRRLDYEVARAILDAAIKNLGLASTADTIWSNHD